jgi:GDP-4-dehydro-6-deoxy-D-mannose reductase
MRVLVTGASGFSGRHMIHHLASPSGEGPEIFGLIRSSSLQDENGMIPVKADLMDRDQVARLVHDVAPDIVIHLAGLNRGPLKDLLEVNVVGTEHLLDAILHLVPEARVLVVGSSAEYGYAGEEPVRETAPLHPVSPYGISKAAQDLLAIRYHSVYNLSVAIAVPFNLIGPGLPDSFVTSRIISQAMEIVGGKRSTIDLLGLASRRDFVDVRDAVAAYWQIASADGYEERIAGEKINIGSGTAHSIAEVLDLVRRILGAEFAVKIPEKSPLDAIPTQIADINRMRKLVGWSPRITLETSIRDMLANSEMG